MFGRLICCSRGADSRESGIVKVLIVDDVQFMLISLKQLLERNGYEVATASTGSEALECLSTDFMIDVVITDLMMPEMGGLEIYRRAQMIELFNDDGMIPPPPFLLFTSLDKSNLISTWGTQLKEAQLHFAGVLFKPVEESILLPLLQQIQHQKTDVGRESAQLREILQRSLDQLEQTRSAGDGTAVVGQLQQRLKEFQTDAVTC